MLSIVIPVYNEMETLSQLHEELDDVASQHDLELEIIFVDDGSSDGSWEAIERLAAQDARVQGIRLRRNFGKAAALSAGFEAARGELVVTLDADLQDDLREIPRFLDEMNNDLDVVSGWKRVRHDPWHKVIPSRIFNWMVGFLTGVRLHDHNCGFKCYRRTVLEEIDLDRITSEGYSFQIETTFRAWRRGFKIGEIKIIFSDRTEGSSKMSGKIIREAVWKVWWLRLLRTVRKL